MLGEGRLLVRFDMRGTGLSQREVGALSHDAAVQDVAAVVKACGLRQFTLVGPGFSGPRAIDFAARHPRLVANLVLYDTFARASDMIAEPVVQAYAQLARANWAVGAQTIADLTMRADLPNEALRWAELFQQSATGEVVARLFMEGYASTDVRSLLSRVKAKTLVVHHLEAPVFAFASGQQLATEINGARLAPLPGSVAGYFSGFASPELDVLNEFLAASQPPSSGADAASPAHRANGVRTILFTDVVGHTEMMQRLGDAPGRAILREHEEITRSLLRAHDGDEVKTLGDGFMAAFSSVVGAMECAIALQSAFADRNESSVEPIAVRVGLNAGEPIAEDGDYFGSSVILAARIAAQAGSGEIMCSLAVRELCAGKKFLFADRGERLLRGFEDAARVYEVHWRGAASR
jgi:class 3 adenylate cyclase/pimeloyl-ACP methyl ester carboxylesterase